MFTVDVKQQYNNNNKCSSERANNRTKFSISLFYGGRGGERTTGGRWVYQVWTIHPIIVLPIAIFQREMEGKLVSDSFKAELYFSVPIRVFSRSYMVEATAREIRQ